MSTTVYKVETFQDGGYRYLASYFDAMEACSYCDDLAKLTGWAFRVTEYYEANSGVKITSVIYNTSLDNQVGSIGDYTPPKGRRGLTACYELAESPPLTKIKTKCFQEIEC